MINKKNKPDRLSAVILMSALLLLFGLAPPDKEPPERAERLFPLFGHFYPGASTNVFSIPNSRLGSGIR